MRTRIFIYARSNKLAIDIAISLADQVLYYHGHRCIFLIYFFDCSEESLWISADVLLEQLAGQILVHSMLSVDILLLSMRLCGT